MKNIFLFAVLFIGLAGSTIAQTVHPGGFPTPITGVGHETTALYNFIFWIIAVVAVIVAIPILISIIRFRRSVNKKAATFSHNTTIEIIWTLIPALICIVLAYKAFNTMVYLREIPEDGITAEVVGLQFGWNFYYPDFAEGEAYVAAPEPLEAYSPISVEGKPRYAKELVVPKGINVKLNVTSLDVIHAFFAPDLGIKIDAMPGRINYAWFNAEKTGIYVGQCAELCGAEHGEMFFLVKVVEWPEFVTYVNKIRDDAGLEPLTEDAIKKRIPTVTTSA